MADGTRLNKVTPGNEGDLAATHDASDGMKHQQVEVEYLDRNGQPKKADYKGVPVQQESRFLDAFGRIRFSSPQTLFDLKHLYHKHPLICDEEITNTSGSATSTHSAVNAAVTLHAEVNDTLIRQTKMRFNYQPGKSQLIMLTGILGGDVTNLIRRIGLYDANDGLFFERNGATVNVVIRKATADTPVAQNTWNIDKLDGTGGSGITLDPTKTQIFLIDFEWLGVGLIRFGFVINGEIVYCHQINNTNVATSVYMSVPNLPVRYEIVSTGGVGDLVQVCSTVIAEGGHDALGVSFSEDLGKDHINANAIGTEYALLGFQLKSTQLGAIIKPRIISLVALTNDSFLWRLSYNPTVDGTFDFVAKTNSALEIVKGNSDGSNVVSVVGDVFASGYVSNQVREILGDVEDTRRLGAKIDGTRDNMVLSVIPMTSNLDILGAVTWRAGNLP